MVTQLRYPKVIASDAVYDAMLSGNSTGPVTLQSMLQWLGLPDTVIGIAHHVFDQVMNSLESLRVCLLPI